MWVTYLCLLHVCPGGIKYLTMLFSAINYVVMDDRVLMFSFIEIWMNLSSITSLIDMVRQTFVFGLFQYFDLVPCWIFSGPLLVVPLSGWRTTCRLNICCRILYSITIVLQLNMQFLNLLGIPQTVNIRFVGEAEEWDSQDVERQWGDRLVY